MNQKEFLEQLQTLVGFRTLTGDVDENAKALDYVESLLSPKAVVARQKNGKAEILLASNIETDLPDFGYMVHMDVVAASEKMFTMREESGMLFGRGVSDMKFSVPIGIALLNEIIDTNASVSFCLAITTDEEIGGFDGGAHLAHKMQWRPKALIVPDGGDNLCFVDKAKGVCQLSISATGKSAHASRTWQGENAILKLSAVVVELERRYGKNNHVENWNTTLNFGQFHAGISTNQVCNEAVLKTDFRYPESDSAARIEQEVREIIESIDSSMTITRESMGLPTFTDVELPVVKQFLACMKQQFGDVIKIQPTFGASDARHFAPFKTPVLMIKPLGGDIHCETEWLDIASTLDFYQALRKFLLS